MVRQLREARSPVCTKPWTSLEERTNRTGRIQVCCWARHPLGEIGSQGSTGDLLAIWHGEELRTVRRKMLDGRVGDICSSRCPILRNRDMFFEKQELYAYSRDELSSFDEPFLRNRLRVLRSILKRETACDTFPLRVKLHPSTKCNFKCVMCAVGRKDEDTDKPLYSETGLNALGPYLEELKVFGGEPLACPTSQRILFTERGFAQIQYATITNGSLMKGQNLDDLARLRIGWIDLSLDTCNPETYKKIREGGDFSRVMENVKALIEVRDRHPIRRFPIYGNFVIQKWNYKEIEPFVSFCLRLGIHPNMNLVVGNTELLGNLDAVKKHLRQGIRSAQQLDDPFAIQNLNIVLDDLPLYRRELQKLLLTNLANSTRVGTRLVDVAKRVRSSISDRSQKTARP